MNEKIDILFACDMNESRPWFRDRIPGIEDAIKKVNFTIKLIDIYAILGEHKYNPTHVSERNLFLQNSNILEANQNFEQNILKYMPKVLILGTADNYHQFLMPQTIRNIRSKGILVAGILGDDEFNYPVYRFLLGWFDRFIAYVQPCVDYYEKFHLSKGYFFPNSCFLNNKKFNEYYQNTEYDAILVGAPIANRPEMIQALIKENLNIAIFGSKKWQEYEFAKDYYYGFIPTEQFDEVLSKGKIVLSFLEDHISGKLHMNTKIWEAARVARLPISTYYEPLEKDYGLKEGVDIITYKSTSELVEKVKYYANNDYDRLNIATNLYSKIEKNFDYSIMYKNLFENLMSLKKIDNRHIDIYDFIEKSTELKYFKSKTCELDTEVYNHICIINEIKSESYDYVYFNKIENGKRVINRWPFVYFDSIVFLHKQRNSFNYLRVFIFGRALHIHQFCAVSDKKTLFGNINRKIDKFLETKLGTIFINIKKKAK